MCLPIQFCAGLAYYPRCCSFAGSRCIPAIYTRFGLFAGLPVAGLMMTGPADDDEKRGFSYYLNFRGFASDQLTGKGHRVAGSPGRRAKGHLGEDHR
jgi:hypothetical protein